MDLWTDWLNAGERITAIGGSDYHYPPKPDFGLFGERLGQPTTHVYAEELSGPAVLDGVRRGRAYVSKGPRITFQAEMSGESYMIGDDLGENIGEVEFSVNISNQPDNTIAQLVRNGEIVATEQIGDGESSVHFREQVDPKRSDWYRLDVLDGGGEALAITNPIFSNFRKNDESGVWNRYHAKDQPALTTQRVLFKARYGQAFHSQIVH